MQECDQICSKIQAGILTSEVAVESNWNASIMCSVQKEHFFRLSYELFFESIQDLSIQRVCGPIYLQLFLHLYCQVVLVGLWSVLHVRSLWIDLCRVDREVASSHELFRACNRQKSPVHELFGYQRLEILNHLTSWRKLSLPCKLSHTNIYIYRRLCFFVTSQMLVLFFTWGWVSPRYVRVKVDCTTSCFTVALVQGIQSSYYIVVLSYVGVKYTSSRTWRIANCAHRRQHETAFLDWHLLWLYIPWIEATALRERRWG